MLPWPPPSLTELAADAPDVVRGAVGGAGLLVSLFGARLYRPGLLLGAFGAGAMAAVGVLHTASEWVPSATDPTTVAVAAVTTGTIGAVVAHLAHKLALVVVGALLGLVGSAALLGAVALPWWVVPAGAAAGAIAMPRVYPHLLKVVTPAVGAALLVWALGRPESPWLFGGAWLAGCLYQLRGSSRPTDDEDEDA